MNVDDVQTPDLPKTCWLEEIFKKQEELLHKYHPIEKSNGLLQTEKHPLDLNDRFCQQRIKDFLWRITEEISESFECIIAGGKDRFDTHHREELIDALHFLVELTIMVGMGPSDVTGITHGKDAQLRLQYLVCIIGGAWEAKGEHYAFKTIYHLGLTANCLKNKPWKQTHQLTDEAEFKKHLIKAWYFFGLLLSDRGFTPEEVYCLYFKKNAVNKFRQRSNY